MSDLEQGICRRCRFWNPALRVKTARASGEERNVASRGQCRRYAPQPSALTTTWMETKGDDWCGEFQPFT
ncbi:MAG: hypothetical protein ACPGO3_06455 [Magnetospiraceae bacterium]